MENSVIVLDSSDDEVSLCLYYCPVLLGGGVAKFDIVQNASTVLCS